MQQALSTNWQSIFRVVAPRAPLPRLYTVLGQQLPPVAASQRRSGAAGKRHLIIQVTTAGLGRVRDAQGSRDLPPGSCLICPAAAPGVQWFPPTDGPGWTFLAACLDGAAAELVMAAAGEASALDLRDPAPLQAAILAHAGRWPADSMLPLRPPRWEPVQDAVTNARAAWAIADAVLAGLQPPAASDLVAQAQSLVTGNYRLSVAMLAAKLGVTREHLARSFRAAGQVTPQRLIAASRCAEAARRLRSGPQPIAQIARDLGFSDATAFSRTFARIRGCSPRSYRIGSGFDDA